VSTLDALSTARPQSGTRVNRLISLASALLLLAMLGCSALLYRRSLGVPEPIAGLKLGATEVGAISGSELRRAIAAEASRFGQGAVTLQWDSFTFDVKRRDLGARVDTAATRRRLLRVGKSGRFFSDLSERVRARRSKLSVPLDVRLDRDVALAFFIRLKEKLDRQPVPVRLDLENQRVAPGQNGYLLRVYDCLAATELAFRRGQRRIALAVTLLKPPGEALDKLDISHVLGHFSTAYSLKEKDRDRAHNLKVGASKLDGKVIRPGESLSYNTVVGPRNKGQGYRMAPVISQGELVDGMAGGSCQLSSTLFAASFFAGLELTSSRPHTRPSHYIKMGLDATVAYPTTDLVIKNPYSFPVVLHFTVKQGRVRVRILGQKRPWRRVVFEREIKQVIPFNEVVREDPEIPAGRQVISQVGVPGFVLERRRLLYGKGAEPQTVERRELRYPPTTQYVRKGTGPANPDWEPPKEREPFGEAKTTFSMEQ
jgi:vancomycin resistance protein YoaR